MTAKTMRSAMAVALSICCLMASQSAIGQWPVELRDGDRPTLAPLLERVTPAVVNISVTATVQTRVNPLMQDPFFRHFFNLPNQPRAIPRQSAGSGVIVDADEGYV
ncbi:MAG: serine endoprotease DegQ, partial [Woeseiaceae bacterium]|nr:serine endoprotease DegQ [Woeseiaceae bacterium]